MNFAEQLDLLPQMNLAEQLNLVEEQIKMLNEVEDYPPVEQVVVTLADNRVAKTYVTSDEVFDVILDTLIVHQSEIDDYWCSAILPQPIEDEKLFNVNLTKQGYDHIKTVLEQTGILLKAEKRPDARALKRKERPEPPSWAVLTDETKPLPAYMYLAPQSEEAEEAIMRGSEIPYKKIRIKKLASPHCGSATVLASQDVTLASLNC